MSVRTIRMDTSLVVTSVLASGDNCPLENLFELNQIKLRKRLIFAYAFLHVDTCKNILRGPMSQLWVDYVVFGFIKKNKNKEFSLCLYFHTSFPRLL